MNELLDNHLWNLIGLLFCFFVSGGVGYAIGKQSQNSLIALIKEESRHYKKLSDSYCEDWHKERNKRENMKKHLRFILEVKEAGE